PYRELRSFPTRRSSDLARKPYWYDEIRDYLIRRWGAEVVDGQEADDAIGIAAWNSYKECPEYSIIASIDKDLRMIPGYHYNWVKDRKSTRLNSSHVKIS